MKPTSFPQSTKWLAKSQEQYIDLPAHFDTAESIMTTCWSLSWKERIKLLLTGRLWLQQITFGAPLQPQRPSADDPFA